MEVNAHSIKNVSNSPGVGEDEDLAAPGATEKPDTRKRGQQLIQ